MNGRCSKAGDAKTQFPAISREHIYRDVWLVVWNMTFMTFHILGIVTPSDYFSEGLKPPTRCGRIWYCIQDDLSKPV
jgi:hypothetical protein